jgi:hypothetical protein
MRMFAPRHLTHFFIAFLAALALSVFTPSAAGSEPQRIVAIGDIHGEFDGLASILEQAKIIDAQHRWTGGSAVLVQTGDFLDRGPKSRAVMDLLVSLEQQAPKQDGKVVVLLGNHEVMNLIGDLRYVAPEAYAEFADAGSEKRRRQAYEQYVDWRKRRAKKLGEPPPPLTPEEERQWLAAHPAGFVEHRDGFSPRGKYGKWLRGRQSVHEAARVLFLHGGISPELASWTVDAFNQRLREELQLFDRAAEWMQRERLILPFFTLEEIVPLAQQELEARTKAAGSREESPEQKAQRAMLEAVAGYRSWLSFHSDGPLWYRGYAKWSDAEGAAQIQKILDNYKATAVVVGHTPQDSGRIRARFSGKAFLIDTGMLASYYPGGQASALEIQDGRFTAIYRDQRIVLLEPPKAQAVAASAPTSATVAPSAEKPPAGAALRRRWTGPDGQILPFNTDEALLEFLRTARVEKMSSIPQGITHPRKVLLEKDGIQMHAVFRDIDEEKASAQLAMGSMEFFFRDCFIFEPAAYELSRVLGLNNVPPAILRTIEGKKGSLQAWVENALTETSRTKKKIQPPDEQQRAKQIHNMWTFDALVFNTDRNSGNILYDKDWKLWLIDHTRAFRRFPDLQRPIQASRCDRKLWERLQNVDDATIGERLKPYLSSWEIKGLLERRRKLVAHLRKLIAERGEAKVLFDYEELAGTAAVP